jgi:hypothetical protein
MGAYGVSKVMIPGKCGIHLEVERGPQKSLFPSNALLKKGANGTHTGNV